MLHTVRFYHMLDFVDNEMECALNELLESYTERVFPVQRSSPQGSPTNLGHRKPPGEIFRFRSLARCMMAWKSNGIPGTRTLVRSWKPGMVAEIIFMCGMFVLRSIRVVNSDSRGHMRGSTRRESRGSALGCSAST